MSEAAEQQERDLDVAIMREREAVDALQRGDYLDAIEAAGAIMTFAAKAAARDAPVAIVDIDRLGNHHDVEHIALAPGEEEIVDVDGKASIRIRGAKRYDEEVTDDV